jgi:hypothetical protein
MVSKTSIVSYTTEQIVDIPGIRYLFLRGEKPEVWRVTWADRRIKRLDGLELDEANRLRSGGSMFELFEEQGNEDGSEDRFHKRIENFLVQKKRIIVHHFWWFVHNVVAHPLMGLFPIKFFFAFHDWTARRMNLGQERKRTS